MKRKLLAKRKDHLTKKQRSYCMSRVKGRDTSLELLIRSRLHNEGLRFRKNVSELLGKPDIVFPKSRTVVFLDGDFWHGYRFQTWNQTLKPYWKKKIAGNIARDRRNHRKLRYNGWKVIRIWEHQVKKNVDEVIQIIAQSVKHRESGNKNRGPRSHSPQ